jgi:hypothetical protein
VGFTSHNSGVGSFEQQIGYQTYKMTDDLRAVLHEASLLYYPNPHITDDLGAIQIRSVVEW